MTIDGITSASAKLRGGDSTGQLRLELHPNEKGGDVLAVYTENRSVEISLVLPGGRELTRTRAQESGFEWEMGRLQSSENPDAMKRLPDTRHLIRFPPNQPADAYVIRADTGRLPEGSTLATNFIEARVAPAILGLDGVQVEVTSNKIFYAQGEQPTIRLSARDGLRSPKLLSVTGNLYRTMNHEKVGSPMPFIFMPGDGWYLAGLGRLAIGTYMVEWRVSGNRANKESFSRFGSLQLAVGPHYGDIVGFTDRGTDRDGEGRFTTVEIVAKVRIFIPGNYTLDIVATGDVFGSSGEKWEHGFYSGPLQTGDHDIVIKLDGKLLAQTGPGPFRIINAKLMSAAGPPPAVRQAPSFQMAVSSGQLPL